MTPLFSHKTTNQGASAIKILTIYENNCEFSLYAQGAPESISDQTNDQSIKFKIFKINKALI